MRIQDVTSAIVKRIWVVIAMVLIAALVGTIVAYIQSPVYKVEIVVVATPPKNPTTRLPDATIAGRPHSRKRCLDGGRPHGKEKPRGPAPRRPGRIEGDALSGA